MVEGLWREGGEGGGDGDDRVGDIDMISVIFFLALV